MPGGARPDLLIVGAGPVGCVVAERAASVKGWTSLIVERRGHIAGNCHDAVDADGLLVHSYGPHYFRTNSQPVYDYLSRHTEWIAGNYIVKSAHRGEYFPFPINLTTLEQFFGLRLTPAAAEQLLEEKRDKSITVPRNSEELILSRVGRELYEAFYRGYTRKQWGREARELRRVARVEVREVVAVAGRADVPIREPPHQVAGQAPGDNLRFTVLRRGLEDQYRALTSQHIVNELVQGLTNGVREAGAMELGEGIGDVLREVPTGLPARLKLPCGVQGGYHSAAPFRIAASWSSDRSSALMPTMPSGPPSGPLSSVLSTIIPR